MRIGKPAAIFLSVIFFIELLLLLFFLLFFWEGLGDFLIEYRFIFQIVLWVGGAYLSKRFYNYIYDDVKIKEGRHAVAVYSSTSDKGRKVVVGLVTLVFIVFIVYASIMIFSSNNIDTDNEVSINHFNNQNISFNYSNNWSIESNNSTDIVLVDSYGRYIYISIDKTDGYTLDMLYNLYRSSWEEDENISIINSTNIKINNIPAIVSYLNISYNETVNMSEEMLNIVSFLNIKPNETKHTNSYKIIMTKEDKYYLISYYYTGDAINEKEFKIFINSFKV